MCNFEDLNTAAVPAQPQSQPVPEALVYEMHEGRPIYYRGYRDVLAGHKTLEEVMSDSSLQAWLKGKLLFVLQEQLTAGKFDITVGEHGLWMDKGQWRAADLAIFRFEDLELDAHYARRAPEVVMEIDTKADLEGFGTMLDYYDQKVDFLLQFGVRKIIWIFTDSRSVRVVDDQAGSRSFGWDDSVEVLPAVRFNLAQLFERFNRPLP